MFYSQVIKNTFRYSLLYSGTDLQLEEIRGEDFHEEKASNPNNLMLQNHFDCSNYPTGSPLHCDKNKMISLKFKDGMARKIIREILGLKAKMNSINYENQRKC